MSWLEIGVILLLLILNGLLAMAELAIVGSKKGKLRAMESAGSAGARCALALADSPGRFLSTVQIGITLFSVVSGVIGGALLADDAAGRLAPLISADGSSPDWLHPSALVLVSLLITYFAVVIGELVPKRIALNHPEVVACALAPGIERLTRWLSPIVTAINASTDWLLGLIGMKKNLTDSVSEDEVRIMIDEGLSTGVFRPEEKAMVEGVFELDDLTAEELMTPRAQLVCLSLTDPPEENWASIARSGHSHFPVYEGNRDNVTGMVSVKALWANLAMVGHADLRSVMSPPVYVPLTLPASTLLAEFKRSGRHNVLVADEFGGLQGMVTLKDVMMAIVGDLPEKGQRGFPIAVQRADGSWLIDALMDIGDFKKQVGIDGDLPGEEDEFNTLAGYVLSSLGHIPKAGETFCWQSYRFEVVDMDRLRIDKVLVSILSPSGKSPSSDGQDPMI